MNRRISYHHSCQNNGHCMVKFNNPSSKPSASNFPDLTAIVFVPRCHQRSIWWELHLAVTLALLLTRMTQTPNFQVFDSTVSQRKKPSSLTREKEGNTKHKFHQCPLPKYDMGLSQIQIPNYMRQAFCNNSI